MIFGEYVFAPSAEVESAKAALTERIVECIRREAKKDEFWIIKPVDGVWLTPGLREMCGDDVVTVGWKIELPTLKEDTDENPYL